MYVLQEYFDRGDATIPILQLPTCDSYKDVKSQIMKIQEQIEHNEIIVIRETLELIKKTEAATIRRLVKENVLRSIEWCKEHDESIAICWTSDLDKNVTKETNDLLHILNPATNMLTYTHNSWNHRSTFSNTLTFEGFRSGTIQPLTVTNPFTRTRLPKP